MTPPRRSRKPGRRPKVEEAERQECCIWPAGGSICRSPLKDGLAVCADHATILRASAGHECAWPPCSQYAPYRALCPYHEKVVRGILTPALTQ